MLELPTKSLSHHSRTDSQLILESSGRKEQWEQTSFYQGKRWDLSLFSVTPHFQLGHPKKHFAKQMDSVFQILL